MLMTVCGSFSICYECQYLANLNVFTFPSITVFLNHYDLIIQNQFGLTFCMFCFDSHHYLLQDIVAMLLPSSSNYKHTGSKGVFTVTEKDAKFLWKIKFINLWTMPGKVIWMKILNYDFKTYFKMMLNVYCIEWK